MPSFQRGSLTLSSDLVLARIARQVVHDFDVRLVTVLGRFLRIGLEVIDAAQVIEVVEPEAIVVAAEYGHLVDGGRGDFDPGIESPPDSRR